MLLVALAVTLAGAPDTSFREVVLAHVARYPAMTVTDLYKLTHQAAFGAEHAIPDSATAAAWLEREWSTLPATSAEPLLDTIAPGGAAVRISLRAWKASGRSQVAVLRAFLATGREHRGDAPRFERYWGDIIALAQKSKIPFDVETLVRYADQMRTRGYPAVSHSDIYKRAYAPAYRVVSRKALEEKG